MRNALLHTGVAALLSFFLLLISANTGSAATSVATPLSTHVLNITLDAAGWPTDAAALDTYVAGLASQVSTTVCGSLPSTVSNCTAFMMAVSATSSPVKVAVQVSVLTASYGAGNGTYTLLSQWAAGKNLFSLPAISGTLPTPSYSTGSYTVPCRGAQSYAFLPACAPSETPHTIVYVQTTSTALQSTFLSYLCPTSAPTPCAASVTVTSSTDSYQVVNITGTSRGLEAVLAFVADARASYLGPSATTNVVPGETTGDSSKHLGVTAVELRYRAVRATLFSANENQRTYMTSAHLSLQCESSYNLWAIAFVVIPFLAIGLFRYIWYRGRHRSKKHERRRIVADETRIMQGYTNPADAPATEAAPPPGVDTSALAPQWAMDENGNYYDANAAGAANGNDVPPATRGVDSVTYQTWVDPETGETYQYAVASSAAGAATGADATQQQQQPEAGGEGDVTYQTYVDPETGETYQYAVDSSTAGAAADEAQDQSQAAQQSGDAGVTHQMYVDPDTGETYQYAVDKATGGASAANAGAQQTAEAGGGDGSVSYQTYVDPETGETYQYAVDPANARTQDEPVAQTAVEAATTDGYQTYVDPETGETHQYSTADNAGGADGADGQQYEYVDPNTGETYRYDASAVQNDGVADAAAAGDTDAAGTYQYVDPETGETYQYQDAYAAQ
ncbi:hypothetical protein ABB37_02412 [Leptomonas pyrrhocoris]|uniref:Uncharacterized protein n=1 Tax=Leptomonas pyrrhocoris TaxID=157538 RepID=A0A0N0DYQ9_LEPPY|nr:hypothetical protein ABB37_02412 [Leptomonas pyrrhocoris]KPA84445.1 hypothetical protein ABB37_02412 [Leptomonas pyrrhocoris]|eukprot:XP_015662884.1 hypothetical protein ABB37_02412 [Leptomonas pyrrhocoris]